MYDNTVNVCGYVSFVIKRIAELVRSSKGCITSFNYLHVANSVKTKVMFKRISVLLMSYGLTKRYTSSGTRFYIDCKSALYEYLMTDEGVKKIIDFVCQQYQWRYGDKRSR